MSRITLFKLFIGLSLGIAANCLGAAKPAELGYEILEKRPHDPQLFTQGFFVQDQWLVESSGGYGRSLLRRYHKDTGRIRDQLPLPTQVFAEGAAPTPNGIWVLTWRAGIAYQLHTQSLELLQQVRFQGEGWGLTFDGEQLIMSNGSSSLIFREPATFEELKRVAVRSQGQHWTRLNELEFAEGYIWANVWQDSRIIAIHPVSGAVVAVVDLSRLRAKNQTQPDAVLNGIAYDPTQKAFWITGKLWKQRYLIRFSGLPPMDSAERPTPANEPE